MITKIFFNKELSKPRILVAPLDWGLGHATRCIPIINELISLNCEVFLAADKHTFSLLQKEFPSTVILRLKGYNVSYSRNRIWLPLKILQQVPKIIWNVCKENQWLNRMINQYNFDAVISDNRFGLYSGKVPCIYITHQLMIRTGNFFSEKIAQKIHYFFIKKFTACWVPDTEQNGLAGLLSHPSKIPFNVKYIGPLSRFHSIKNKEKKYDLMFSISGPEPQRSIWEEIILNQLINFRGNAIVIRGLPSNVDEIQSHNKMIHIVNHLAGSEFNQAIEESEIIISRSGYTTIMDLIKLNKRAVLVPTPGQTEQEYLAQYLMDQKYFYCSPQENFSLTQSLKNYHSFNFAEMSIPTEFYKIVIKEFVRSLKTGNFASQ